MAVTVDAQRLVGLLATPERLRAVAAMVLGHTTVAQIAVATGLDERTTTEALGRLVAAGLVENLDGSFVVLEAAFSLAARPSHTEPCGDERPVDERDRTLRRVFDGERLLEIPTKRSTRRIVLDHLAQRFEIGRRYTEREVNASLARVHPDTAALRRYLVDEGLLSREAGEYWRIGGTVELD